MLALMTSRAADLLPLFVLLSSFVPGLLIAVIGDRRVALRTGLNLLGAVIKVICVGLMLWGSARGRTFVWELPVVPGLSITLIADPLSLLFVTLSAVLWLLTTIYAIGYLEGSPNRSRFFAFFSLCVTATAGIALAGDLFTFVVFYEALTWATFPLVVHRGTATSLAAGRTYLLYTVGGGTLLLVGVIWLYTVAGTIDFVDGGALGHVTADRYPELIWIFVLLMIGLGVKAALWPLHGWLPIAMVAPAPVSALLHAVAVVKAGAFGIVRLIYSVYGIEFATVLGVAQWVAGAAAVTILYGSIRALGQDDLKKRLAYSTVSQVSYITLGVATFGPMATVGGLVHLVHQGLMKITLFFCAGNLAETIHVKRVSEMAGVGRRMPVTMAAFTIGAFGMIGLPPVAGFISKYYLGIGAVQAGALWIVPVLVASSMLNAAYFLPIVHTAWFGHARPADGAEADAEADADAMAAAGREQRLATREEAPLLLLLPTVITAGLALGVGLFAAAEWSPLGWARLIVQRTYGP
jgi:multicomponent Na+:H+ antiporter subunit D